MEAGLLFLLRHTDDFQYAAAQECGVVRKLKSDQANELSGDQESEQSRRNHRGGQLVPRSLAGREPSGNRPKGDHRRKVEAKEEAKPRYAEFGENLHPQGVRFLTWEPAIFG